MDLIGKPRSKSVVWMYFGFRADENGFPLRSDEVICRLCRKIVLAKGGNTTNLRSHLKRRHRAEVANTPFSASLGIGPETHDLGHSHEELIQELQSLSAQTETNQNYVPDAVLPPGEPWTNGGPSRAVLSLPSCLSLSEHSGNQVSSPSSESPAREMKVIARCQLQIGTMFGPYVGEMCRGHVPDNLAHAWAIRDESAFIYVDGTDLNKSNWMRFVTFTSYEDEQNLTVFQFYRKIYYKVSQPISEGDDLKVWVGRDYASLLGLEHTGENMKCQVGDKESFLRSLQDIQFSTLPEPTTSALWSDNSQSQSPMPIISEVTSINTSGGTEPISTAVPSSSHSYFPVPHPYENKYHFLPGTERLVGHPDHLHLPMSGDGSLWYFFGFEPDHNGRPLDRGNAICKLCGELVFCGSGGLIEIKNHMGNKHHIKPRESTNTSIIRPGSVQRTVLPPVTTTHSSANLTDNILYFLIMDLQPPSVVRGKGFQHLINTLLPNKVDLPSKTKLDYLLKDMHAKGKTDLAQTLRTKTETADYTAPLESERNRRRKDVRHLVNFSVDVWFHTWQGNTEMYLSLWVHYMDANFICHNQALASQKLSKSGLNLKAVESQVRAMAEIWGISQANLTVLGGEGWNDIRAIPMFSGNSVEASGSNTHPNSTSFLESDESTSPMEQENGVENQIIEGLPSVPCFFTAVQSCIDELISMNAISKVLSKFQSILTGLFMEPIQTGIHSETFADHLLQGMTKEEQLEVKIWIHSRPTWNKLYLLLNTLLKHKALLRDILNKLKEDTSPESSSASSSTSNQFLRAEWKVVEDLCLVLKPLDVACQTLAKEEFPRLSLIKPILTGLLTRHLVTRPGDSPILKEAKTMMRYNLSDWYGSPTVNRVLNVACALDPQFHGVGFMSEQEQSETYQWLKNEAVRISNEAQTKLRLKKSQPEDGNKRSPSPSTPDESRRRSKRLKDSQPINFCDIDVSEGEGSDVDWVEPPPGDGLSGMQFLLGDLYSTGTRSKQKSVEESVELEINVFRSDNGATLGVEPLQWWRSKTLQLPLLATVAQAYLSAPAVAGNAAHGYLQDGAGTSRGKRSNIPPENLDAILFLHHNNFHKSKLKLY
ncbi:unnamed protein product [Knipowitschia caucasica]